MKSAPRRLTRLGSFAATAALTVAALAGISGCSSDNNGESSSASQSEQAEEQGTEQILSIVDPWVKANEGAKMTAAFGVLHNETGKDIHITGGSTDAAGKFELHTVTDVDGKMQMIELEDGITIPAGGEHILEPGADHLMFMMMKEDLQPGAEVEITLQTDAGEFTFTAPVRTFAGANEEYGAHGEDTEGDMEDEQQKDDGK